MTVLKSFAAAAVALSAALGLAGVANAAPAFAGNTGTNTVTDSATPVRYGCYPVYRWVHTYYGWRQVYAGQRCPGYYGYPYGRYRGPGIRIRIGF
jgi:hypothetical protein